MKVLCIGDIVGRVGRDMVFTHLDRLLSEVDFVIANAENAAHGKGITRNVYEELKRAGIDAFTLGNHAWGCADAPNVLRFNSDIIRPANFDASCPGSGSMILKSRNGIEIGVINLIGRIYMQPADSPFTAVDTIIKKMKERTNIIFVDFHAEATSEKIAMGYHLDGKVTAVFGTHTHVQTADDTILPEGTGYITDLGMCGPVHSVLGVEKNAVIKRFVDGMPSKFEVATGKGRFCACVFEIDENTGKTLSTKRIYIE